MRTVTKENLIVQIDRLRKVKDEQGQLSMNGEYTLQAYEMLLATMEAEPVEVKGSDELYDVIDDDGDVVLSAISFNEAQTESDGYDGENLYIVRHEAQSVPVVPDEVTTEDCPALVKYDVTEVDEAWVRGFNACRAAMLNK